MKIQGPMTVKEQFASGNPEPARFEENTGPLLIAGLSKNYLSGTSMNAVAQWAQFAYYLGKIPGQRKNVAYGLCFDAGDSGGIAYLCGVEVSGTGNLPDTFTIKQLPVCKYAVFTHTGHVSGIHGTCDAIWKVWVPRSGYRKPEDADFFFERYGEGFDPHKGTGDIEIWVPVKK